VSKYGTCLVENHDGVPVVTRADPTVLISNELLEHLDAARVRRDGNDLTFGAPGRGLGTVTYTIVGEEFEMDAVVAERTA
jgi:hypothetical protein